MRAAALLLALGAASGLVHRATEFGCRVCRAASDVLSDLVAKNETEAIVDAIGVPVCIAISGVGECDREDYGACLDLCTGIVQEYGFLILQIISDDLSTQEPCAGLGVCDEPPEREIPTEPVVPSDLSDLSGEKAWPAWDQGGDVGYFLQITDVHLDKKYQAGYSYECGLPICCRPQGGARPGFNGTAAGYWGTPGADCDTPPYLSEALHEELRRWEPRPDFVLSTGDAPAHDIWRQSQEANLEMLNVFVSHQMKGFPDAPVFPSCGNHLAFPVDSYSSPERDAWLYTNLTSAYGYWLPSDALKTLGYAGYYAARARPGLRVVNVNSNYLHMNGLWHYDNTLPYPEPAAQSAWINDTLRQAAALGERVILTGHHNVGDWANAETVIREVLSEFPGLVVAAMNGHQHSNGYRIISDTDDSPLFVNYNGGSLTTGKSGNPGMIKYYYSRSTGDLLDVEWWWPDLSVANARGRARPPEWEARYSAKRDLGLEDMSAASWEDFAQRIESDDDLYNAWETVVNKGLYTPSYDATGALQRRLETLCEPRGASYRKCMGGTDASRREGICPPPEGWTDAAGTLLAAAPHMCVSL